jgi:hypothetical protein
LAEYYFDSETLQWIGPFIITVGGKIITGMTGRPVLVQSTMGGGDGTFEMLVPQGNAIRHYWKDNQVYDSPWHQRRTLPRLILTSRHTITAGGVTPSRSGTLASGLSDSLTAVNSTLRSDLADSHIAETVEVTYLYPTPAEPLGVALIQANLPSSKPEIQLVAVVHMKSPVHDEDFLIEYRFDTKTLVWSESSSPIIADGKTISGITDF